MDLLKISINEESSVLTEGDMSFTLYMYIADTRIMYCYFEPRTTRHHALVVSVSDFQGPFPGGRLLQIVFFFFHFFRLVKENYFIQEI